MLNHNGITRFNSPRVKNDGTGKDSVNDAVFGGNNVGSKVTVSKVA